ncbi:MAG: DUF2200 domain-containing protein [Bifidobacteriaceae bacterium]|jgi:hypothetical protein|nr:DUF2200 domain-containing protein [Bifidobacteriaceae bacterium]
MKNDQLFQFSFTSIYPLYTAKVERKGRTSADVDAAITWLTGYSAEDLHAMAPTVTLEQFFAQAPAYNPNAKLIRGVVCGVRVEDIDNPLLQKIRFMDKLIDELAKGKALEKILR